MKNIAVKQSSVANLIPDAKNARVHFNKQIKQIANSIKAFGFNNPILIDGQNKVIAGHGRLMAAKELGLEQVPTIEISHLSKHQIQAYMIADNKLAENATWDNKLLAEHFIELSNLDLEFDLGVIGFEMGEIDFIIEESSVETEEDSQPEPVDEEKAITKSGDLWLLGGHRIYCGNSLEEESYNILMDGKRAGVVFTDPPYNVPIDKHVCGLGKTKHKEFAMASGEMTKKQFIQFLEQSFSCLTKFSKDGSIHFICMDWRHMSEILSAGDKAYTELKNMCVWVKDNGGMGSLYRSQHELVFKTSA